MKFEIKSGSSYLANDRARYRYNPPRHARARRARREHHRHLALDQRAPLPLLQEALRTAALAKRTRDASSTRARLSLRAQRFRGVGQGGRSRGALGLNHGVARLPRWPTGWAESLSRSLAGQGAGLRLGRSRWSGHDPRGRERWFGPDPLRTTDRGLWLRGAPAQRRKPNARPPYLAACTRSKRPQSGRRQRPALGPS